MPNFFEELARRAEDLHTFAHVGPYQPLRRIEDKAWQLATWIDGHTCGSSSDKMMQEAYNLWLEALKWNFGIYIINQLSKGRRLKDIQIKKFDAEFRRYLARERWLRGESRDLRSFIFHITATNADEDQKNAMLAVYRSVLRLYTEAMRASWYKDDKAWFRNRIKSFDYVISMITNKDGVAETMWQKHMKKMRKRHAQRLAEVEAENKAKELEVPS